MKKPLKNLDGEYVLTADGKPRRFTKRDALTHGKGGYSLGGPRVWIDDAGPHWILRREPAKN